MYKLINFLKPLSKSSVFWIFVIITISSFFRFSFPDLIEYKADEATTVFQTIQFFEQPYLVERGLISGTGVYNFPFFNYAMILLALPSRDPQFLSLFIALINVFLVAVFYILIKKYYGQLIAVLSSLILASAPWGVIFSRKIWAQDLIFLILIPILWSLHELILKKNARATPILFIMLAFLVQLHGSGIFLLAATVIIFLILRVRFDIKGAIIGTVVGVIPVIPYILFQVNSSCLDCTALTKYQQSIRNFDIYSFIRPFQIISGMGYHFILGKDYSSFVSTIPFFNILKNLFLLGFIMPVVGAIYILVKKRSLLFLLFYFSLIPIIYFLTKTIAYMHYFVILLPITALLFAIAFSFIYRSFNNRLFKMGVLVLFMVFIFNNIIFNIFFFRYLSNKKIIEGDYGPVFEVTKEFVDKQTQEYKSLSYYYDLQNYAFIYARSNNFHAKLGEFFMEKGAQDLSMQEFKRDKEGGDGL